MSRPRKHTEAQVLEAIQTWLLQHGAPPTVEELRRALGLGSTRTALRYLSWLEQSGAIERWPGARGVRLLRGAGGRLATRSVPIVGQAPAGPLMAAEENIEGWIRLPAEFLRGGAQIKYFLLRVRGDSMNRAMVAGEPIEPGDLVLVRQQATSDPGAIVVAVVDGEATIKQYTRGPGYSVLRPVSSNPIHQPIVVTSGFRIQGVVTRVLKRGSELLGVIDD